MRIGGVARATPTGGGMKGALPVVPQRGLRSVMTQAHPSSAHLLREVVMIPSGSEIRATGTQSQRDRRGPATRAIKGVDTAGKPQAGPGFAHTPKKAGGRRILVVGDKPAYGPLRQSLMRVVDLDLLSANTGSEGLRVAREQRPDAIILDDDLADAASLDLCGQLHVDPITEGIPVIMLTGKTSGAAAESSLQNSAVATVPIGIDPARLLNVMQMVLTTRLAHRSAPRVAVEIGVDYQSGDCKGTAKTLNLGEGGMFVSVANPPEVGTALDVCFALPESDPLQVRGRVVWVRRPEEPHPYPAGMAIQFIDVPAEERAAIAAFVDRTLGEPEDSRPKPRR